MLGRGGWEEGREGKEGKEGKEGRGGKEGKAGSKGDRRINEAGDNGSMAGAMRWHSGEGRRV